MEPSSGPVGRNTKTGTCSPSNDGTSRLSGCVSCAGGSAFPGDRNSTISPVDGTYRNTVGGVTGEL